MNNNTSDDNRANQLTLLYNQSNMQSYNNSYWAIEYFMLCIIMQLHQTGKADLIKENYRKYDYDGQDLDFSNKNHFVAYIMAMGHKSENFGYRGGASTGVKDIIDQIDGNNILQKCIEDILAIEDPNKIESCIRKFLDELKNCGIKTLRNVQTNRLLAVLFPEYYTRIFTEHNKYTSLSSIITFLSNLNIIDIKNPDHETHSGKNKILTKELDTALKDIAHIPQEDGEYIKSDLYDSFEIVKGFDDYWDTCRSEKYVDNIEIHHPDISQDFQEVEDIAYYCWRNTFVWCIGEFMSNPFTHKKATIKYGAPGTGKTYTSKEQAKTIISNWIMTNNVSEKDFIPNSYEFVQFHPSYSYEDFIEGMRINKNGNLSFTNGIFKNLCKKASQWEIDIFNSSLKDKDITEITLEDMFGNNKPKDDFSGKHWDFIKGFNHAYTLEDVKIIDILPPYIIIIDEINRAELSRVLGELMYCLEYRGVNGKIKTQYSNLDTEETGILKVSDDEYEFFIPHNVYIMGTMNSIDRSVESMDFALRRRFQWEEVSINYGVLQKYLTNKFDDKQATDLVNALRKLNNKITNDPNLGSDYQIGQSYLMNLSYTDKGEIWNNEIVHIIQEYLRGSMSEDISEFKQEFIG